MNKDYKDEMNNFDKGSNADTYCFFATLTAIFLFIFIKVLLPLGELAAQKLINKLNITI